MFHFKGELKHKRVKRFYARTNKTKMFVTQIAKHLRRERILCKIFQRVKHQAAEKNPLSSNVAANSSTSLPSRQPPAPSIPFEQSDPLPLTPPELHHHISNTQQFHENIPRWLDLHDEDVALINFLPQLKDHLLSRLLGHVFNGVEPTFTDDERDSVEIIYNWMYRHKTMCVNYTTYDMQREQDTVNPRTRPDIMVLSYEDDGDSYHPYWYACVLGIFHVNIQHTTPHLATSQSF
ncbi:hypothetical protein B0H34DRAFT_658016 [Crassisporium funariophilum]|nr:hypothetical protein B0H34DRAFT_658016 [Crassisporium funariophilum]